MPDASATFKATIITGGPGSGKTQRLIERVSNLLANGVEPDDILVLCATPQAAYELNCRLKKVFAIDERSVDVTTARNLALGALADEAAVEFTGRSPRLLANFEELFLMEDVKVSGLRTSRLREMLKFFFRSWTELADDDPDWLITKEETEIHDLLKANLGLMDAMLEPEVSNLAVKYLRANAEARNAHGRMHVLFDDFQNASRASQILASLLATQSLTVAGDKNACVQVYDSYPFSTGLDEFVQTYPEANKETLTTTHRSQASAIAAQKLLTENPAEKEPSAIDPNKPTSKATILSSSSPNEEFLSIARAVNDAIDAGVPASRIVIATPNDVWSRNIAKALRAQGLRAETLPSTQPLRGDIRDNDHCIPARVITALILASNPHDSAAWRCWCGFGDYLTNSAAIAKLRTIAEKQGLRFEEALEIAAKKAEANGDTSDIAHVISAYRKGLELIEKTRGLAGRELLDEITNTVTNGEESTASTSIDLLCLKENDSEDAISMAQKAMQRLLAPTASEKEAVAIVPYDLTCGLSPDVLVVSGFVNGFIPCRDFFDSAVTPPDKQERMHLRDTKRMYSLLGKADKTLIVSYFTAIDLESGSKLKLKLDRIRLDHGIRTCTIAPSDFLAVIEPTK